MESPATALEQFGNWVARLDPAGQPPSLVAKAKGHLLDILGLMVTGSRHEKLEPARRFVGLSGARQTDAAQLAFLGGVAADALWLDDFDELTRIHPGAAVIPPLLALGRKRASGPDLLAGLLAGYETVCRLGELCESAGLHERGFHPSAILGSLGAAAAAARFSGLPASQISNCMGLAVSLSSGLFELDPAGLIKGLQVGLSARNGLLALRLHQAGYRASGSVIEGRRGFVQAFGPRSERVGPDLNRLLDTSLRLERISFKPYTHFTDLHPLTALLLDLLERESLPPAEIARVEVHLPKGSEVKLNPAFPPASLKLARRCPAFVLASILCRPPASRLDPLLDRFQSGLLRDSAVLELGARICWQADLPPHGPPRARLEIELAGGRTRRAEGSGYPGDGRQPKTRWTFSQAEARFRHLTRDQLDQQTARRWVETVWRLESVAELRPLIGTLTGLLTGR